MNSVLACQDLYKSFSEGKAELPILKGISFSLQRGERVAVMGASGCGKTTLLQILGGIDTPTRGKVLMNNKELSFVFQFHHLLPEFTALENVCMPPLIHGMSPKEAAQKAEVILGKVHLDQRMEHKPGELSGGERQRVAIARALVTNPLCVLADEPTGNLDRKTAEEVFNLMLELNQSTGTALLVVTHDQQIANRMDRIYILEDGKLL